MKFLQRGGDSVVSLRFKFRGPEQGRENIDLTSESLTFDTVEEIQAALAQLFPDGNAPFTLQEDILDLDSIRAGGDYTQADMVNALSRFQGNLNTMLDNRGDQEAVDAFMNALQEFMNARAIDLSEFHHERSDLLGLVEAQSAAVDSTLERFSLAQEIAANTPEEAEVVAELKEGAELPPEVRAAGTEAVNQDFIRQAPITLASILDEMREETDDRFGPSSFRAFDPDQFA